MNFLNPRGSYPKEFKKQMGFFFGPTLAILVYVNPLSSLPNDAHTLAAILTWVVITWITEAIPLAVTSLLGATLCVAAGLGSAKEVLSSFAHPIIFLFIGSFLLAEAFVVHGLDRRFALWILSMKWVSVRPSGVFLSLGCATAFLSMWVSNTASVAIMVPIALGILTTLRNTEELSKDHEPGLLLLLAYGSAAGGMATMIGTPPNLIGVGLLSQQAGVSLSFVDWILVASPVACLMFIVIYGLLCWLHPISKQFTVLESYIEGLRHQQGKWTYGQINTCLALVFAVCCWIGPGVLAAFVGQDSPFISLINERFPKELVPIFAAGILFILPVNFREGQFTLSWSQATNINWGTILLFGGGLAFGHLMVETGLARILGEDLVEIFGGNTLWSLTAVAIGAALVLTEIASNTAAASMLVPIVISIAQAANVSPVPPTLGVCFAASLAFALPVSTPPNAIVYGTGLIPLHNMLKAGLLLDLVGGVLIWAMLWVIWPLWGLS